MILLFYTLIYTLQFHKKGRKGSAILMGVYKRFSSTVQGEKMEFVKGKVKRGSNREKLAQWAVCYSVQCVHEENFCT